MEVRIPRGRKLSKLLGDKATTALEYCLNSIERILPHIELTSLTVDTRYPAKVVWVGTQRTQLRVTFSVSVNPGYSVACIVQRKAVPTGVGAVSRALDSHEKAVCESIVDVASTYFSSDGPPPKSSIVTIETLFDELVVANYLSTQHDLKLYAFEFFVSLRHLAEQTYENSAYTFGCIIETGDFSAAGEATIFPRAYFGMKRYRALSDAYYTAYKISNAGNLLSFIDLYEAIGKKATRSYFPEWCAQFAEKSRTAKLGFALNRQGEIFVIEKGTLRFSYRFGKWQYWNHAHLIDLAKNIIRTQHVPVGIVAKVANAVYRAALDVSFRRSGGLFVILKNKRLLRKIVRAPDIIGHRRRSDLNTAFDRALPAKMVQTLPRTVLLELSSLDGAIVCSNNGELLAYGAVLEPRRKGRSTAAEGSRTKAAIGASLYGLSLKISSDGEIGMYRMGKRFLQI